MPKCAPSADFTGPRFDHTKPFFDNTHPFHKENIFGGRSLKGFCGSCYDTLFQDDCDMPDWDDISCYPCLMKTRTLYTEAYRKKGDSITGDEGYFIDTIIGCINNAIIQSLENKLIINNIEYKITADEVDAKDAAEAAYYVAKDAAEAAKNAADKAAADAIDAVAAEASAADFLAAAAEAASEFAAEASKAASEVAAAEAAHAAAEAAVAELAEPEAPEERPRYQLACFTREEIENLEAKREKLLREKADLHGSDGCTEGPEPKKLKTDE